MNSKLKLFSVAMLAASSFSTLADVMTQDAIKVKFESLLPFSVTEIKQAPIKDFFQIETEKGIFYASTDGKKIFSGSLHKFEEGLLNLTAKRQQELTKKQLADLQDELIIYQAPNEKYVVTVFTDPTCGYCRKLHQEMKEYNDLGITIAYAAYPRAGVNSEMSTTLNNIWCSSDQVDAMNKAKTDRPFPTVKCKSPVEKMYNIGSAMGIHGTPALILPNGEMVPGYQPAKQLLNTLENLG
jgi:thiol:disulfide interchange protein DsbC